VNCYNAQAEISEEHKERFERQLERKGCASIEITVKVFDEKATVTMCRTYEWFAQKI